MQHSFVRASGLTESRGSRFAQCKRQSEGSWALASLVLGSFLVLASLTSQQHTSLLSSPSSFPHSTLPPSDPHPFSLLPLFSRSSWFVFPLPLSLPLLFVSAQSCPYGYVGSPSCLTKNDCIWSLTSAICSLTGSPNTTETSGTIIDGPASTARFNQVFGVAAPNMFPNASSAVLYVSDQVNNAIRKVDVVNGTVSTLVVDTQLKSPSTLVVLDPSTNRNPLYPNHLLVVSYSGGSLMSVSLTFPYTVTRVCGDGTNGNVEGDCSVTRFNQPRGLAVHSSGAYALVGDSGNYVIRLVNLTSQPHTSRTIAGAATVNSYVVNVAGLTARFGLVTSVLFDRTNESFVYASDLSNDVVYRVSLGTGATGAVSITWVERFAGDRSFQATTESSNALTAKIREPLSITFDPWHHFMYCTTYLSVVKIDMQKVNNPVTAVLNLATTNGAVDSFNGKAGIVKVNQPRQAAFMVNPVSKRMIMYLADHLNHKLRSVVVPPEMPLAPTMRGATMLNLTSINVSFTVNWHGGDALTNCTATSSAGNTASVSATANVDPTSVVVAGLTTGVSYTFTVICSNSMGSSSSSSSSNSVLLASVPSAPTITGVSLLSLTSVSLAFTPGAANGASITSCTVLASPGGASWMSPPISPILFPGLVAGSTYTFSVRCNNSIGGSAWSASSAAIALDLPPEAPTLNSVMPLITDADLESPTARAAINFTLPATAAGSSALRNCTVTAVPVGSAAADQTLNATLVLPTNLTAAAAASSQSLVLPSLVWGCNYSVSVRCANSLGLGAASSPLQFVWVVAAPSRPTVVMARAISARNASVSFLASADHGSAVRNCTAIAVAWPASFGGELLAASNSVASSASVSDSAGTIAGGSLQQVRLDGLSSGAHYRFYVTCSNGLGRSLPSEGVGPCRRCCAQASWAGGVAGENIRAAAQC